jgi:DNA-binding MarR family transcriptional regulator
MALLQQWHRQRPWLAAGIAGLTGGLVGAGQLVASALPWNWSVAGTISQPVANQWEHPLRQKVLSTLEEHPGLCYRELQKKLSVANGTLRHHLDVLISTRSIAVVSVNGRSCHYAGAPSQLEVIRHLEFDSDEQAAQIMPVGLSTVQKLVVARLTKDPLPQSQAAMARDLGRSRASVHSATKVLRRRGIVHAHELDLAPHLSGLRSGELDYDWIDERPHTA